MNEIEQLLSKLCDKHKVPGAVVGLWHKDKLTTATYGVLNSEHKAPVLSNSMFQIGSITKVFTATLIMQLVDEGLLILDKPVKSYLPEFRVADYDVTQTVTVRHLLNHTSGLGGDMMTDCGIGVDALRRYVDKCSLLSNCHPVGSGFSYSNSAFNILGRVIEVISGKTYDQALEEKILRKLDLKNSIADISKMVGRSVSAGHSINENGEHIPLDTIFTIPATTAPAGATLVMSVSDLIDFTRMHLNNGMSDEGEKILSEDSVCLMQKTSVEVPFPPRDIAEWGLGWAKYKHSNGTLIGHDGATIGQFAYLRVDPLSGSIVVLFLNGGNANDCMMELFSESYDNLTGIKPNPHPKISAECPFQIDKLVGTYETVTGKYIVSLQDEQLLISTVWKIDDQLINFAEPTPIFFSNGTTFITKPLEGGLPTSFSFMDFNSNKIPQSLFTGLRVANRKK